MKALPRRILFVAHDTGLYGAQTSLLALLKHLNKDEYESFVIVPGKGAFVDLVEAYGIKTMVYPVRRWIYSRKVFSYNVIFTSPWKLFRLPVDLFRFLVFFPIRVFWLARLIRKQRIEIVYTNTITVLDAAVAAKITGVPHVWHIREAICGNRELVSILPCDRVPAITKWFSKKIIVNSDFLKLKLFPAIDSAVEVKTIYNGVDVNDYMNLPAVTRMALFSDMSDDITLVGICGYMQQRKGHKHFVQMAKRILTNRDNVEFLIIGGGDPEYVRQVKGLIESLGIKDKFHILGMRTDIPVLMSALDVLVVTANQEPFGRVVIEAMAAGKPVVSTRCGGPEEIIIHGQTGFLVDIGDVNEMAQYVELLIDDKDMSFRYGENGRQRVASNFSNEATVRSIELVFDEATRE